MYSKKLKIDNEQWEMKREKIFHSPFSIVNSENGQTLIELIVVVSVSVIVVGALVFATIASLRNAQFSKNQAQATKLAQEGLEKVRSARDRYGSITGFGDSITYSWNSSPALPIVSIWNYRLPPCTSPSNNYFEIIDVPNTPSQLNYIQCSSTFPSISENPLGDGKLRRDIILSDTSMPGTEMSVTAIVKWTDFSGDHQSQLQTVLGKITQ